MNKLIFICLVFNLMACVHPGNRDEYKDVGPIRMENIAFYSLNSPEGDSIRYKNRITYYFDDGRPYRYTETDSTGNLLTDFFYSYDTRGIRTGALYREQGDPDYSIERLVYAEDSLEITTEWVDSTDAVYYRMVESYDDKGRLLSAVFIGDEIHGHDTIRYHKNDLISRIFFTNTRGKVFNDRYFEYPVINGRGDWMVRHKLTRDTLREIHIRDIAYGDDILDAPYPFYPVMISERAGNENKISFSSDRRWALFTRGRQWSRQRAFLSFKEGGIYLEPQEVEILDTIYNAALSPSGSSIIFCRRLSSGLLVGLTRRVNGQWSNPLNLSAENGLEAGYFHWYDEEELYFYVPGGNGDLVTGQLVGELLQVRDTLHVLNTPDATEFSPFVGPGKSYILFTRYLDGIKDQQGIFISINTGTEDQPNWKMPVKVEGLPYGWGVFVLSENGRVVLSDGKDILHYSIDVLAPYLE